MKIKPITEAVLYALLAQRLGQTHPPYEAIVDARRGLVFVPAPSF